MQLHTQTSIPVGGYRCMQPGQIIRLEADRNYTRLYLANGKKLMVATTLKVIEARLMEHGFVRITRGDVINRAFVRKIWKDGAIQLTDGTQIYPSRRRQGVLKKGTLLPVHEEAP